MGISKTHIGFFLSIFEFAHGVMFTFIIDLNFCFLWILKKSELFSNIKIHDHFCFLAAETGPVDPFHWRVWMIRSEMVV